MAGGASVAAQQKAAAAKGAAESNAEQQRNAQEQAQSKGPSGNPSGSSFGGNSKNITFDKAGNTLVDGKITQFAGANARDTYFSDRGVGNNGIVTNQGLFQTADFSNLSPGAARDNAQQQGSTFESGGSKVYDKDTQGNETGYHLVDTSGRITFTHDNLTGKDTVVPFKPESDISLSVSDKSTPKKEVIDPSLYGYTKNAVLDPRIKLLGENKSPLEINFDVTQAGKSAQAGKAIGRLGAKINTGGGVETEKSKEAGDAYSIAKLGGDNLVRGSGTENAKIKSEAERASSISFSNKDYATGGKADIESKVTIGPKEEMVFGKTVDDQFGWHDIGKTQISRGSDLEKSLTINEKPKTTTSEPTSYTPRNESEKMQIESWLSNVNAMGAGNFNTYDAAKALGYVKSSSIGTGSYNPSGKFGGLPGEYGNPLEDKSITTGANTKSVLLTENLNLNDNLSSTKSSTNVIGPKSNLTRDQIDKQNRDYADYVGKYGQEGATIDLFSNGKLVGSVSGKQAYRDAIIMSRDYPGGLEARAVFSTTREGKDLIDSIIQNARQTNAPSGSILVFDTSKSVFPLKDQGRVVASIPLSNAEKELPSVIDRYAGNPNIKFGSFGTNIDTPQNSTLVPSAVLPLDLASISSKSFIGKYFDVNQFLGGLGEQAKVGASKPLIAPNATTNQFGITLPDPSLTLREFGENFGAFVAGGVKTFPPLLAGLGTSYYNFFNSSKVNTPSSFQDFVTNQKSPIEFSGSTGGPAVQANSPKALANVIAQSLLEPTVFMGEKAGKNYNATATFIHENIGKPIREQGIETPVGVSSPKTLGAFGGTVAGVATMIPMEAIPLRVVDLPFSIVTTEGKVFTQPKGLALGYGGSRTVPLVLKTPSGYKVFPNVKNTIESVLPSNTGQIKYSVSRTQELSTLQGYQSKVINSENFRNRVDELGLNVKNTGEPFPGGALPYNAMEAARLTEEVAKGTQKAKNTGPLRPLASEEQASVSPNVVTPLGETIAKQQSPTRKLLSVFTLYKIPYVKNVQGSQLTYAVLSDKENADFVGMRGGPLDFDITTDTALGFREEQNAENAAKEAQLNIGRAQGLAPTRNTAYRGLDVRDLDQIIAGKKTIEQTSTTPEVYASPQSGTALFFGRLFHGRNASLAKLTYKNENDVLRFEEIPKKSRGGKNPIQNWRTANPILIDYARNVGARVLRKPIKTGGQEDIILDTGVIQSIEKISPDIQIIRQEGKRLYADTPQGEEKIAEFLTKHDSTETGSGMGKASKVYGENIATKSFKYEVPGSKKKISGFGRKYQTQTQFARTGLFSKEQAEGQNGTPRQLELIGEKTAFGPELYKKSAVIDAYLLTRDQAKELMKSPRTRESGRTLFESNEKLLKIQADLYEIDLTKPLAPSGKTQYDLSIIAENNSGRGSTSQALLASFGNTSRLNPNASSTVSFGNSGYSKNSRLSSSMFDSSLSARVSAFSRLSAYSGKSNYSVFSAKSAFSQKSGKSGKSGNSSVLSSMSGLSALSSMPSGLSPGPSGGPSGRSAFGGSGKNESAFSGISSFSSFSGFSKSFNFSIIDTTNRNIILPIIPGNFGRKRRTPKNDGFTTLFKFDVKNPFSTSLSIIEKGNLTWL